MSKTTKGQVRDARILAEMSVDRVATMILSSDRDAGWGGNHPLGRFFDLQGHQPARSGYSGISRVWEQTATLNDWPERYQVARDLLGKISTDHRQAVLIDRLCRGKTLGTKQDGHVRYSDDLIASSLGVTQEAFRQRISRGYRRLILLLAPELKGGVTRGD